MTCVCVCVLVMVLVLVLVSVFEEVLWWRVGPGRVCGVCECGWTRGSVREGTSGAGVRVGGVRLCGERRLCVVLGGWGSERRVEEEPEVRERKKR